MNSNGSVLGTINEIVEQYHAWIFIKILFLVGILVYCFFTLSVYRQTQLMDKVLQIKITPSFKTIALIYFALSIAYFLIALIVL